MLSVCQQYLCHRFPQGGIFFSNGSCEVKSCKWFAYVGRRVPTKTCVGEGYFAFLKKGGGRLMEFGGPKARPTLKRHPLCSRELVCWSVEAPTMQQT